MKIIRMFGVFTMVLVLMGGALWASESEIAGNVRFIGSTAPPDNWVNEAKVEAGYTVRMPLFQGEGPLFSQNNLKLKGVLGVTPITGSLTFEAVLTPIAVMELSVGGVMGTGWNFDLMELEGLRRNDGTGTVEDSLGGMYYKGKAGVALQFDTAAIWPGDWTSVVMRTYHEVNYQGYLTGNTPSGGWEFETGGLHKDGLNYKGEYLIGYQMPLIIDTVALMLETYVDNIGNDLEVEMLMDVGLVMNFGLTDRLNLTVIPQLTTKGTDADRAFEKVDLQFKRVAAMVNYAL